MGGSLGISELKSRNIKGLAESDTPYNKAVSTIINPKRRPTHGLLSHRTMDSESLSAQFNFGLRGGRR